MLRIGFDAKQLFNNFTGPGNYSRTLLANLAEYYPDIAYFLYTPTITQNEETRFFLNSPMYSVHKPKHGGSLLWRNFGIKRELRRHKVQLFHGLRHELPVGLGHMFIKTMVTVHDLSHRRFPQHYSLMQRQLREIRTRHSCEQADHIVAISKHTKRELIHFYGLPPEKISVIYQSCHERYMHEKPNKTKQAVRKRYELPEQYMLSVGSVHQRKNLLGAIKALASLPESLRLPLVVVGRGGNYRRAVQHYIRQHHLSPWVKFLKVEFEDLPAVYQCASLFLYPSLYEGFGIPILEALFSKIPVLTSNTSSLPEAGGPGAHLVDPHSTEDIAAGITKILEDTAYQQQLVQKGYQHAQQFLGRPLTEQMMKLYQQVIGEEYILPETIT